MALYLAQPAGMQRRHVLQALSFLLFVILPTALVGWYLYNRAQDQFVSETSFSIRSEEFRNPMDVLAGLGQVSSGSANDVQILYEFIQSQQLVELIGARIDLRRVFAGRGNDPVFELPAGASREKLVDHWQRMVKVYRDKSSGVLSIETRAFSPEDAREINTVILAESQKLVDRLSRVAREDATRYAQEELDRAAERLSAARSNFSAYRARTRIIDPAVELQNQAGVQSALRQQLAEALITRDQLTATTRDESDPRISQTDRRIDAIRRRLDNERAGEPAKEDEGLAKVVGEFESLRAEQQFAETAFYAASAALDSARGEATRRSRYLSVHIDPTLSETSTRPRRLTLTAVAGVFLLLLWTIGSMVFYSLRDRR